MLKINNVILIKDISEIRKCFTDMSVVVNDTYELNNVVISYNEYPKPKKDLPTKTDEEEREWIFEEINSAINKIRRHRYTRKAIIYNLHVSGLKHNCLNLFHLYYRKKKLYLNVYVRSMNFTDNFEHDMYTFDTVLNIACKKLKLNKGQVIVFIMSLHKFNVTLTSFKKRRKIKKNKRIKENKYG